MSDICPDCKRPVESHAMYKDGRCPVVRFKGLPKLERLPSFWGESVLSMRYVAFGPRGELQRWPDSRLRRLWMRLRGWTFVEDSMVENQRRLNYLRSTPEWTASVERLSLAEVHERYGEGVASPDAEKDRL